MMPWTTADIESAYEDLLAEGLIVEYTDKDGETWVMLAK